MHILNKIFHTKNNLQLSLVFITYSITGSLSVFLSKPLIELIGITHEYLPYIIYFPLYIFAVLIIYQFLLIIVGSLFGQFSYFKNQYKKLFLRIIKTFK